MALGSDIISGVTHDQQDFTKKLPQLRTHIDINEVSLQSYLMIMWRSCEELHAYFANWQSEQTVSR